MLTAGMPAATSLHSHHPGPSAGSRYNDEEAWDDDQSQRDGTASFLHAGPEYISSRAPPTSPPRSRSPRSPSQQQRQSSSPMRRAGAQFPSDPSAPQAPDRSFTTPLHEGQLSNGGNTHGLPLDRGMSRGMLEKQGSRALHLQPQGSRALHGQRSSAGGLVKGQSRGLGSKERLWGAAEGSGTWPLRDSHGANQTPGMQCPPARDPAILPESQSAWDNLHGLRCIVMNLKPVIKLKAY